MIFEPTTIAKMELSNRFVRSATYDGMPTGTERSPTNRSRYTPHWPGAASG
jgi:2,4-dienoyl-CoA reductase-like NADH-dependent reductase (Old Yellow Enzyme family)